jgi:hypothetical protein
MPLRSCSQKEFSQVIASVTEVISALVAGELVVTWWPASTRDGEAQKGITLVASQRNCSTAR